MNFLYNAFLQCVTKGQGVKFMVAFLTTRFTHDAVSLIILLSLNRYYNQIRVITAT